MVVPSILSVKALVLDANLDIVGIHNIETDNLTVNGTLVTASAVELNYTDVSTIGTADPGKALVTDLNKDIGGIRNLSATNLTGTLQTAAQPNVTSVGTLTSLAVTGNVSAANVTASEYHIRSVGTGISAAGSTQGGATLLTKEINVVSTVGSGAGVLLQTAVAGMVIIITNNGANPLSVYPGIGAQINALAANAAFPQPTSSTLQFVAISSTQWYTIGATYA